MKALNKIFVLSLFTLLLVSCGSDSNNKTKLQFAGTLRHNVEIKGVKDYQQTLPTQSIAIEDLWADHEVVAAKVVDGEFLNSSEDTYFRITGLDENTVLTDFVVTLNGMMLDLGAVTYRNADLYTNKTSSYFENVFYSIIRQQKLTVGLKFVANRDITSEDDIKLEISYKGYFYYYK